ncbi:MAG TPA: TIGR00730 family Rossman fold protein [Acidimicrobiales bacterium]|nr:TIGR00730 family Rossman fold protein [Acidimicrobiales bacterium]
MTETRTDVDRLVVELLDATGAHANRDLLREIFAAAVELSEQGTSRLDLKIVSAAIAEMSDAFRMFAPYKAVPKVTIFGSARTAPTDALYAQARELAQRMSQAGWMVVTGAGPGIMAAGAEGAGPEMAIGVNIRLPFEQVPSDTFAHDPKLVQMRYFFTRKLMLMKESSGFVALPGGFGTLDETFELMTLLQTGKAEPAPIVLVDCPGDSYWAGFERFVREQVIDRKLASPDDSALYRITDNVDTAMAEITGFYRNYHSRRFVGATMVIRLKLGVSDEELDRINREFAGICGPAGIRRTEALPAERSGRDHVELPRIALEFDRTHHGRLRMLIDELNRCNGPGAAS